MKTWVQRVRRMDGTTTGHSNADKNNRWPDGIKKFHVHIGYYGSANRPQVTLIAAGKPYTFEGSDDKLGKRVATGTLEEMQEVYETYAQML